MAGKFAYKRKSMQTKKVKFFTADNFIYGRFLIPNQQRLLVKISKSTHFML